MSDVKLYDWLSSKVVTVLGGTAAGSLVVRYKNAPDDVTCTIDEKILRCSPDFVAVCAHYYTANDLCPGCDADYDELINMVERYGVEVSDHIGQALGKPNIELGMIYQHADCTWSAVSPSGVVLGSNIVDADSAVRALRLDHKIRVWFTALNDNVLHDARKLDEAAAQNVDTREDYEIRQAVRTLMSYGVTTAAQFVAHVADVLKLDGVLAATEAKILAPEPNVSLVRSGSYTLAGSDDRASVAAHQWVKTRRLGHAHGMPAAKVAPHDGSQL